MIIWQVYRTTYEEFIAPDTDFFLKKTASEDRLQWSCPDQFLCSLLIRAHVSLLLLVNGRRCWQPDSRETRHKSPLPKHTVTHIQPPLSSSLWSAHQHVCLVVWSGKNGSKSENHKSQTGYSVSTITSKHVQAHVCIHTTQTELSGLCSHQCVQLDRERKMGGIVEGVRRSN